VQSSGHTILPAVNGLDTVPSVFEIENTNLHHSDHHAGLPSAALSSLLAVWVTELVQI